MLMSGKIVDAGSRLGPLINSGALTIRDGIRRIVNEP